MYILNRSVEGRACEQLPIMSVTQAQTSEDIIRDWLGMPVLGQPGHSGFNVCELMIKVG